MVRRGIPTMSTEEIDARFPRRDKLLLVSQIHAELIKGTSEDRIADDLGLDREAFDYLHSFMLQERANKKRSRSSDQQFADYEISQERNIADLDNLIQNLNEQTQYNALVGAIRLRSEIQKGILTAGQEFGVIAKQPDRTEIVAGVVVADLSTADLRKMIAGQLASLEGMISKYGDCDIRALETGELHRGPATGTPSGRKKLRQKVATPKRKAAREK